MVHKMQFFVLPPHFCFDLPRVRDFFDFSIGFMIIYPLLLLSSFKAAILSFSFVSLALISFISFMRTLSPKNRRFWATNLTQTCPFKIENVWWWSWNTDVLPSVFFFSLCFLFCFYLIKFILIYFSWGARIVNWSTRSFILMGVFDCKELYICCIVLIKNVFESKPIVLWMFRDSFAKIITFFFVFNNPINPNASYLTHDVWSLHLSNVTIISLKNLMYTVTNIHIFLMKHQ